MSYLHDATPTWNGFNYQGKVALCVTLDKLLQLALANQFIDDYSLELEWLEDFAIKKNDEYETLHQVKNYGKDTLPDFKSALGSLLTKILCVVSNEELKYAITRQKDPVTGLKINKNALAAIMLADLKVANIIDNNNKLVAGADFNNLRLSAGVVEYNDRLKTKLVQLSQIIAHSGSLQRCYLHVAEPLAGNFDVASIEVLDTISPYAAAPDFNAAIQKMELYEYSGGARSCNNAAITVAIDERIKNYLLTVRNLAVDDPKCQDINIARLRHYLLNLIDQNVSDRHEAIRNGAAGLIVNIPLLKFKEVLDNDNVPVNEYYNTFYLKEAFEDALDETLRLYEDDENKYLILLELADNVYKLYPKERFIDFCLKLRPHFADSKNIHGLLSSDGLRDSFFKFFTEYLKCDTAAFVKTPQNEYSLITAILEADFSDKRAAIIYGNIKKNQNDLPPLLFNVNTLVGNIGTGKGGKKFSEIIPNSTTAPDSANSKKITISEDFKIVDITDELNRIKLP
ncbi:MAG TPA: ABC-three component system protein [Bacteroidia bacterium]|jgi:hypothetical protein